jgi:hypothetical protein
MKEITMIYPLSVAYGNIKALIKSGNYDRYHSVLDQAIMSRMVYESGSVHIRERIREGTQNLHAQVVHFDKEMENLDAVHSLLNERGLRAASVEELLAFGAQHPDVQRGFPIVAAGGIVECARTSDPATVILLAGSPTERTVGSTGGVNNFKFPPQCRFLAFAMEYDPVI